MGIYCSCFLFAEIMGIYCSCFLSSFFFTLHSAAKKFMATLKSIFPLTTLCYHHSNHANRCSDTATPLPRLSLVRPAGRGKDRPDPWVGSLTRPPSRRCRLPTVHPAECGTHSGPRWLTCPCG